MYSKETSILAIFFLQALASGGFFTRIPEIQSTLGLNEAELGLILAAQPVGGFASFLIASFVVERVGPRVIFMFGLPSLAFASFLLGMSQTIWLAVASLLYYGASFSILNVAMNVEADRLEAALGRRIMNRCHGFWSIGFLAAAFIGVIATGTSVSPGLHLGLIVPVILLGVGMFGLRFSESAPRHLKAGAKHSTISFPTLAVLGIVCFGLMGSVIQGGTQNWSVIYMRQNFTTSNWVDALSIPIFLITLTIGRLMGDSGLTRFGAFRVAIALVLCSSTGLGLVVFSQHAFVSFVGFALMGFGTSIVFPMMITAAAALGDRPASANVAAVTMTTGIAMLTVPPFMGHIAESYGVRWAFAALAPFLLMALLFVRQIVPRSASD